MKSIWTETAEFARRSGAGGTYLCDAVVIGAGMTGLLTAYFLKKQGLHVIVLEADRIAAGQTEKTTAKITCQHGMIYDRLIQGIGVQKAQLYARANQEAVEAYEHIIRRNTIACGFERLPAYLYSTAGDEALVREGQAACRLGLNAVLDHEAGLPFPVCAALRYDGQAQFHPLQFLKGISEGLEIYEHSPVKRVRGQHVWTEHADFTADKIVFATHYPIRNVPGFYFLRQHQERSYVLALKGCNSLKGMYYSVDQGGISLRCSGDLLLLGGASHRTGKQTVGHPYDYLVQKAQEYFPEGREVCRWWAQDCMPHDGIPFIGRYSRYARDWLVATGYQKWGMSSSMVAARLLSDLVLGKKNPYEAVFTPQRLHWMGAGNFLADVGESVKGLTGGLFHRPRCSHMGCRLHWNAREQIWDCPCHGSCFTRDGQMLCEPAQKSLRKRHDSASA